MFSPANPAASLSLQNFSLCELFPFNGQSKYVGKIEEVHPLVSAPCIHATEAHRKARMPSTELNLVFDTRGRMLSNKVFLQKQISGFDPS